MSQFNWRKYIKPLSAQDKFASNCHYGAEKGDFSLARKDLSEDLNLDVPHVISYAVSGTDPEFLSELFNYYKYNVVEKLATPRERHMARERLKEAVEEEVLRNGVENLAQGIENVIDKEFPEDDRRTEDFINSDVDSSFGHSDHESDEDLPHHPQRNTHVDWSVVLGNTKAYSDSGHEGDT